VPRLRLKAELNGDTVFTRLLQQVVEFAERLHGKRAGRFQEHFEDVRPVAPDKRISAPCIFHTIFSSFTWFVSGEGSKEKEAADDR
jgi:hypothetical protein